MATLIPRIASAMQPAAASQVIKDTPAINRPMTNPIPGLVKANPLSVAAATPRSPLATPTPLPRSPLAMDPRAAQAAQRMLQQPNVLGTLNRSPLQHRGLGIFMR